MLMYAACVTCRLELATSLEIRQNPVSSRARLFWLRLTCTYHMVRSYGVRLLDKSSVRLFDSDVA